MTDALQPMRTFRWKDGTAEHAVTLTLDQARPIHADLGAFILESDAAKEQRAPEASGGTEAGT